MGAVGMQPPWGLAATAIVILVAHITGNVALRVESETEEFPLLMPRVHPHQAESYLCTPIRVDTDVTYSITGFRPNATKMTAHHMLIYGCEEPGAESPTWNCGEMAVKEPGMGSAQPCAKGSQIIYAWAMDAKSLELPKGVGFRVGRDSTVKYLVLQVHYASVDHIPQAGDDSHGRSSPLGHWRLSPAPLNHLLRDGVRNRGPARNSSVCVQDSYAQPRSSCVWVESEEQPGLDSDWQEKPTGATNVLPSGDRYDFVCGRCCGSQMYNGQHQR